MNTNTDFDKIDKVLSKNGGGLCVINNLSSG